jgi:hypothetical protein
MAESTTYQVTDIEFDFTTDDDTSPTPGYQEDLICDVLTSVWQAEDEDDLVETITCATGWCISFIDYHVVPPE